MINVVSATAQFEEPIPDYLVQQLLPLLGALGGQCRDELRSLVAARVINEAREGAGLASEGQGDYDALGFAPPDPLLQL